MSKKYRSAMDEIKMSDALKKKIVKASAQKKRKRLRPVYISAAAGLAACLAIVITLHHASIIRDERVSTPEFETAQASEIPYTAAAENETATSGSAAEPNEKTAVAKADTKTKSEAETADTKTAKATKEAQQNKTETKTKSAQTVVTETKDITASESETNEQPESGDTNPQTDTQIEVASADMAEDATEIMVAKTGEAEATETMPEAAAEPPAASARHSGGGGGGGGTATAASAPMPQPTEDATEEATDENH